MALADSEQIRNCTRQGLLSNVTKVVLTALKDILCTYMLVLEALVRANADLDALKSTRRTGNGSSTIRF